MSIPSSPRVVFRRNVLANVLCQLKFPPVLSIMAKEPAGFQDRIREQYPLYSQDQGIAFPPELKALLGRANFPSVGDHLRHSFQNADASSSIFLTKEFLAIETTKYKRWELFSTEIERAAKALQEEYHPAFYSRIGLRYQDVIDRSTIPGLESVPWHELISPNFIGMLGHEDIRPSIAEQTTQSLISLDELPGAFVRVVHGIPKLAGDGRQNVFNFDADFFIEGRVEHHDVEKIVSTFHLVAGNLFRWAITPRLYDALEPESLSS